MVIFRTEFTTTTFSLTPANQPVRVLLCGKLTRLNRIFQQRTYIMHCLLACLLLPQETPLATKATVSFYCHPHLSCCLLLSAAFFLQFDPCKNPEVSPDKSFILFVPSSPTDGNFFQCQHQMSLKIN